MLRNSVAVDPESNAGIGDLLDRNVATTAAVGLTCLSGGFAGGVMLAAFPAQSLTAVAAIGTLAYVGDRQHKGLPINPFEKDAETKSDTKATAPAAA